MKGRRGKRKSVKTSAPEAVPLHVRAATLLNEHFDTFFYSCVVVGAIVALGTMVDNALYNDDFRWITAARENMTWLNVWTYRVIGFFRPFINLTFWVSEKLAPGNLLIYNTTQIVLHVTNTMLLYHLFRVVFRDRTVAAVSAFSFLVTYNHLGAVIWISGRTTLIMATFLLSSLLAAVGSLTRIRRFTAWGLFGLALASKEEAIVGPLLLWLLYWYRSREAVSPESPNHQAAQRTRADRSVSDRPMLLGFFAVAALYFALRTAAMGHVTQANWGPGLHAIGNLAASFLGQFWPTLLFALTNQPLMARPSESVWWPELLTIPLLAGFLFVGWRIQRLRAMGFALLWMTICILPMIFLKFRFLEMGSAIHTRYYYMSCMGAWLAIALVLVAMWRTSWRPRIVRTAVAVLFLSMCTVEVRRTRNFEVRFSRGNAGMQALVGEITALLDENPEIIRLVIEETPYPRNYLMMSVHLQRPEISLHESDGGLETASQFAPCVYLARSVQEPKRFSLYVLD